MAAKTKPAEPEAFIIDPAWVTEGVGYARKVSRLLRAGMKDAPPTDIRAEALEAADQLDAWCDRWVG